VGVIELEDGVVELEWRGGAELLWEDAVDLEEAGDVELDRGGPGVGPVELEELGCDVVGAVERELP